MSALDDVVYRYESYLRAMDSLSVVLCIVCRNLETFATGLVTEIGTSRVTAIEQVSLLICRSQLVRQGPYNVHLSRSV